MTLSIGIKDLVNDIRWLAGYIHYTFFWSVCLFVFFHLLFCNARVLNCNLNWVQPNGKYVIENGTGRGDAT